MDMTREAITKITELVENKIYEIGGHTYSEKPLERVSTPVFNPDKLIVSGLDSIVQLIKTEINRLICPIFIRVCSPRSVEVFSTFGERYIRQNLYAAKCNTPNFESEWLSHESAIIKLKSQFIQDEGTEYLLGLLGRITQENSVSTNDNGVTQNVEVKAGISLASKEKVKPRIKLCPYRTFLEVAQPESEFILRLDEKGKIGLFEADGGVWQLEAEENIKAYFENELEELIKQEKVIVMA